MQRINEKKNKNKVAEISMLFWLMKIVATTLGETLGDFISMTLNLGYVMGIAITAALFIFILFVQLNLKKYTPAIYWLVIIGTTTLGTEISDFLDRTLLLGYALGSLLLLSLLVLTLYFWYRRYKSLELYPITEKPKEIYYWTAILFSNSLGTAFGDFLTNNLGLTYINGAMITGTFILIVIILHYYTKINHLLLFWIAFIFTRPFGATFGDFLTKTVDAGGLNIGTLNASLISMIIMGACIYFSNKRMKNNPSKPI